jgi:signal transduction histidine kinase
VILLVLPLACVILFFSINYFISDEVDEKLRVDEFRIIQQLETNSEFISMAPIIEVSILENEIKIEESIKNVLVYDPIEKEDELFRELVSVKQINGTWYLIKVRHSIIENEELFLAITLSMGVLLLLIFGLLLFLNNRLSLKLWRPFYQNIERLKLFSFQENKKLELQASDIDEFNDLKTSLILLTSKLQMDYKSLKEFTENASHEIQTPLSIISLNLEEVLQEDHSESNYKKLYACYQSTQRLSKLNEKLLLLAKLDNDQFNEIKSVNFNDLLTEKIEELAPLFENRSLKVNMEAGTAFILDIDLILANILLVNLLSNAIKHSPSDTEIKIEITGESISIANQTKAIVDVDLIFKRFKKGNEASNSTGLGLSIAKRISEVSNLELNANCTENNFKIAINKK